MVLLVCLVVQIVEVLLSEPTDDSVEIAVNFVKEVGQLLEVRSATHTPPPSRRGGR